MDKIIALIKDGTVVNLVIWDGVSPWVPDSQFLPVEVTDLNVTIGDFYDGVIFTTPPETPPPIPEYLQAIDDAISPIAENLNELKQRVDVIAQIVHAPPAPVEPPAPDLGALPSSDTPGE